MGNRVKINRFLWVSHSITKIWFPSLDLNIWTFCLMWSPSIQKMYEYLYLLRTLVYYNISIVLGYKQGVIYFYILPGIMQILWEFAMR